VVDQAVAAARADLERHGKEIARVLKSKRVPIFILNDTPLWIDVKGWTLEVVPGTATTHPTFWKLAAKGVWFNHPLTGLNLRVGDETLRRVWDVEAGRPAAPLPVEGMWQLHLDERLQPVVGASDRVPVEKALEHGLVRLLTR